MDVSKSYHIETIRSDDGQTVHEHIVEIGTSSWDDKLMAIRNRWDTNGRFSPHSSSEVTPEDALLLAAVAIMEGMVSADVIIALQGVINTHAAEAALRNFHHKR